MKSSTLKTIVITLTVAIIIFSFFAGAMYPVVIPPKDSWADPIEKFNTTLMITYWIKGFLFLIAGLCVATVLEHLEFSKEYQVMMIKKIETLDNKINKITTPLN